MVTTYLDIISNLKNKQYAPIYFLQGEEPYFIDNIVNFIDKNALEQIQKSFNQLTIYGKESNLRTILNHAKEYPMMSDRKVILVKEAQEIPGLLTVEGEKVLSSYLESPQPSTILVFAHKYKSLDKRKKITGLINKHCVVLESKKLYDNKIPGWLEGYVKDAGKSINQKALHLIVENIGNDLTRIAKEVDKMFINVENEPQILEEHVYRYIGISKEYNVFELQKALSFKNVLKANEIINYFKSDPKNNPIIPIISNIFALYNRLLLVHDAKDKSERGIAKILGVNPFFVKEYIVAAKNYPLSIVIRNIEYIKKADMKSKGIDHSPQSEGEVLKELIFSLIH